MRLIDADELIVMEYGGIKFVPKEFVDDAPTVDAVELIRCKNCMYQKKGENEEEAWNLCGYRPWMYTPIDDEHFCGYAERRQDD